jgi:hypothetical protein
VCSIWADRNAFIAPDTTLGIDKELRKWVYRFRVVAPLAMETTAFKEDGCANTRPVMDCKPLDIKNPS